MHNKDAHNWTGVGHHHNSTKSIYQYKNYIIKKRDGWNIYDSENNQVNPISHKEYSFKEIKKVLKSLVE